MQIIDGCDVRAVSACVVFCVRGPKAENDVIIASAIILESKLNSY